jgi:hypothetical protein
MTIGKQFNRFHHQFGSATLERLKVIFKLLDFIIIG